MTQQNFFLNQLKQVTDTQKNIAQFLSQNVLAAQQEGQKQQISYLQSALDRAVESRQLSSDTAEKILAWYTASLAAGQEFNNLTQEHLVKTIDELFKQEKANPQNFMTSYFDYLGKVQSQGLKAYNANVKSASDLFSSAYSHVQEVTAQNVQTVKDASEKAVSKAQEHVQEAVKKATRPAVKAAKKTSK